MSSGTSFVGGDVLRRQQTITSVLVVALLLIASSAVSLAARPIRVQGTVTMEEDGTPVVGAQVYVHTVGSDKAVGKGKTKKTGKFSVTFFPITNSSIFTFVIEKDDLLPFEEAKLYGHNAIHAMLAYLGAARGYKKMTELKDDQAVMKVARDAFLNESGAALIKKYAHLGDELFTPSGYRAYADDLLERMTNPYLADTVARAGRDPRRKLAYHDRIFGTMDLAFSEGIEPVNMAVGALAGIGVLLAEDARGGGDHPFASQKAATRDTSINMHLS